MGNDPDQLIGNAAKARFGARSGRPDGGVAPDRTVGGGGDAAEFGEFADGTEMTSAWLRGSPPSTARPVPICPPGYTLSPGYGCVGPSSSDYTEGWPGYDYWPDYSYGYPFGGFPGFGFGPGRFHRFGGFHGFGFGPGRFHRFGGFHGFGFGAGRFHHFAEFPGRAAFHGAARGGGFSPGFGHMGGFGRR